MKKLVQGDRKLILGLTGTFGSGKSTVARIFKSLGAKVIDADKIAHRAILPQSQTYKKIIYAFGGCILKKNNQIDRLKLAHLVFANKKLLMKLNAITHPQIIRIIKDEIRHTKSRFIVLDAPLLIEAGLHKLVDKLVVVKINKFKQMARLLKKTSLTKTGILRRIKAQLPLKYKAAIADFVIDNSGKITETRKQVKTVWRSLATDRK